MNGERDRLRQWLQKKIEAGKTAREGPQFIALEEVARRLQLDVEYLSSRSSHPGRVFDDVPPSVGQCPFADDVAALVRRAFDVHGTGAVRGGMEEQSGGVGGVARPVPRRSWF